MPTLAHTVGRLAPGVARELELAKHGLRLVQPAALATSVGGEGPPITLWADPARTAAGLAVVSAADAAAWESFDAEFRALASTLWRLLLMTPPDTKEANRDVLVSGLKFGWRYRRLEPRHAREFTRMLPTAIADYLEDNLESDALRALLATRGLRYTAMGPHHGGTSAVMLTDSAGNDGGAAGETVYARGGPGALAAALAEAARTAGVEIRTGAEVVAFRDDHESITGVALADGEELEAPDRGQRPGSAHHAAGAARSRDARSRAGLGGRQPARQGRHRQGQPGARRAARLRPGSTATMVPCGCVAASSSRPRCAISTRPPTPPKYGRISEAPWLEATIPSLVDPLLVDGAADWRCEARHERARAVGPVRAPRR